MDTCEVKSNLEADSIINALEVCNNHLIALCNNFYNLNKIKKVMVAIALYGIWKGENSTGLNSKLWQPEAKI